jgi:hypothetical protein
MLGQNLYALPQSTGIFTMVVLAVVLIAIGPFAVLAVGELSLR